MDVQFRAVIEETRRSLGLSKAGLARFLGVGERTVLHWTGRERAVPRGAAARHIVAKLVQADARRAAAVARSLGTSLDALGLAPPAAPAAPAQDPNALDAAVLALAERTDARGKELKPALAAFLAKLDELKLSPKEAADLLARPATATSR